MSLKTYLSEGKKKTYMRVDPRSGLLQVKNKDTGNEVELTKEDIDEMYKMSKRLNITSRKDLG